MSAQGSTDLTHYHLAGPIAARFLGVSVVALAVLVFVATAVVGLAGLDFGWLLLAAVVGLVAVLSFGWWLRTKAYVVRATPQGYSVRLVRGAGVREARWSDVAEVATTTAHGSPCLILRLKDGGTTTIPVAILAIDREEFVNEVKARLSASVRAAGGGGRRRG
ncbi:hypothetical protein AB3X52_00885 [Nocardioides sp. DS6]|uniref:PH domain-containing protein n=1 Tax=Nocardioides eburneus TaxID=3231482 RepID=A0ABV3ST86_9ACTN